MPDQELLDRLDTILSILSIAFEREIEQARDKLMKDPVNRRILETLATGVAAAGPLQDAVKAGTGQSIRTIQSRLAMLAQQGVLQRLGSGPRTSYRAVGPLASVAIKPPGAPGAESSDI